MDGRARLVVVTPLRLECAAVRGRVPGAVVVRSGLGAARAAAAARALTGMPFDALAVTGVCGATAERLHPGDVVVASEVRGPEGVHECETTTMLAALAAAGIGPVHTGPLACTGRLVRGADRTALAAAGVMAADMESAWLAPAATGRPFAVVRVVLDAPGAALAWPPAAVPGAVAAWRALRRLAPALAFWAQSVHDPQVAARD